MMRAIAAKAISAWGREAAPAVTVREVVESGLRVAGGNLHTPHPRPQCQIRSGTAQEAFLRLVCSNAVRSHEKAAAK